MSACAIALMMNCPDVPMSSLLSAYTSPDLLDCSDVQASNVLRGLSLMDTINTVATMGKI